MTRKKATTLQTESKSRRIEIAPQVRKKVTSPLGTHCCLCGRLLPYHKDPLEIVPVCYLVTLYPSGREDREELGLLCSTCSSWATGEDVDQFKKYINTGIIWHCQDVLKVAYLFRDLDLSIPPQHVWIAASAETLANTGQSLKDLARATGLEHEEIVRRLIAQAKPSDLGTPYDI
jgi:hypothetical protein